MVLSKIEKQTAEHLRVLIQTVRVYDEQHGVQSDERNEMLDAAATAEGFLNRVD